MHPADAKPGKNLGKDDFSKIPNGAPGIETRLLLLYEGVRNGHITLNRFVDITSTTPAKLFGLYPRKGTIQPGADADLVIWDPEKEHTISAHTHHMNVDYNPYEGKTVIGAPGRVMLRGKTIYDNGEFTGRIGGGGFVKRNPRQS